MIETGSSVAKPFGEGRGGCEGVGGRGGGSPLAFAHRQSRLVTFLNLLRFLALLTSVYGYNLYRDERDLDLCGTGKGEGRGGDVRGVGVGSLSLLCTQGVSSRHFTLPPPSLSWTADFSL